MRKTENLTLHYKRTLEVSGLENGEDSQQLSSQRNLLLGMQISA